MKILKIKKIIKMLGLLLFRVRTTDEEMVTTAKTVCYSLSEGWTHRVMKPWSWSEDRERGKHVQEPLLCFPWGRTHTLAPWCDELTHLKRPWCWERLRAWGEGDDRGWDDWMTSPTQWTWVWVNFGSWWWTGRPGVLCSCSQKESDMTERLNWGRTDKVG